MASTPKTSVAPVAPTGSSDIINAASPEQVFQDFSAWQAARSPSGSAVADTDWVAVDIADGFSQQGSAKPQVRRDENKVYMRWGWANTGMAANGEYVVGTVPDGFRPVGQDAYGILVGQNGNMTGRLRVSMDGSVRISCCSTIASYYLVAAGTMWFAN